MPTDKKAKRAVRVRTQKTGESYTSARAALDSKDQPSSKISVVEVSQELLERSRRLATVPPMVLVDLGVAFRRLIGNTGARAVLLCNGAGAVIAGQGGAETLRDEVGARVRESYDENTIDLVAPLAGDEHALLCLRRIKVSSRVTWFDFVQARTQYPDAAARYASLHMLRRGEWVFYLATVLENDETLELLRLRIGHAVLEIERAFDRAIANTP
jgi:hypothetical protein